MSNPGSASKEGGKGAKAGGKTVIKLDFEKGDKVRIRDGAFANSEGEVKEITQPKDPGDTLDDEIRTPTRSPTPMVWHGAHIFLNRAWPGWLLMTFAVRSAMSWGGRT